MCFWTVSFIYGYGNSTALGQRTLRKLLSSFGFICFFLFSLSSQMHVFQMQCCKLSKDFVWLVFFFTVVIFSLMPSVWKTEESLRNKDILYWSIKACKYLKKINQSTEKNPNKNPNPQKCRRNKKLITGFLRTEVIKGSSVHLHHYSGVQFKAMTAFVVLMRFLNVCICSNVLQ